MYKLLFFSFCFLSIALGTVHINYSKLSLAGHQSENKTWVHRGGYPENSIAGINYSINEGYQGIQIDLYFNIERNQFLVSSNDPSSQDSTTSTSLESFLKSVPNSTKHWWFSLKNLSEENMEFVIERMSQLSQTYALTNRYFIESDQYTPLSELADAGIPSVYAINLYSNSSFFFFRKLENKIKLLFSDFIGISLSQSDYDNEAKGYLSHLRKFIYGRSDENKDNLISDSTVQVILVKPIFEIDKK